MTDREIRDWATRVVDLYASRVTLTLLEQGALERLVAERFRAAVALAVPVTEWADTANTAIGEWEGGHPQHRGPRVSGFSVGSRQVLEKRQQRF